MVVSTPLLREKERTRQITMVIEGSLHPHLGDSRAPKRATAKAAAEGQ